MKQIFFLLLIPFACMAQKPIPVLQPYNFTKYVLIKNDTVLSKSRLSLTNWDTSYIRSHRHNNLPLLQSIKASDTARWGSSGQTINDGILHWNGTSYIAYPDSTGTGIKNAIYLGNQDPTSQTRINWNGVLHPSGLWVNAPSGSSFVANNTSGIGIQSSTITGYSIQGSAQGGTAGLFSATTGIGTNTISTSGIPLIANNGPGNTSDIFDLRLNNSNKATFDYNGVYSLSGIYKMPGTAGTAGQYLTSSGTGNQLVWTTGSATNNNLLYWNSSLGSYTPYSAISDTSLILYRGNSISSQNSLGYLGLNGQFIAGSSNSSNGRTAIKGVSYYGHGVEGYSTSSHAVYGSSGSNAGVYGITSTGAGVTGNSSSSGMGVQGYSTSGIAGYFNISSSSTNDIVVAAKNYISVFRIDYNGNAYKSTTDTFATQAYARMLTGLGFANPMTTPGDLIVGGTSGAATRKAIGSTNQVLTVSGGVPIWANHWEPTNNLLNYNSTLSAYTPYSSISDTTLSLFRGSAGSLSTYNSTGYLLLNGQFTAGSNNTSNNRTAIRGVSYSGIGLYASSGIGNALYANSVTGVSAVFSNSTGSTADILQAQLNGVNKFRVDYNGSAYKSTTDTFALLSDIRSHLTNDTANLSRNGSMSKYIYNKVKHLITDTVSSDSLLHNAHLTGVSTAPLESKYSSSYQIANSKFVEQNNSRLAMELAALGMNFKALPVGITLTNGGAGETMVSQRLRGSTFYLKDTTVFIGVKFQISTAGAYIAKTAAGPNGIQLYSCTSGTWNIVAGGQILDTAMWKTANLSTKTFSSPLTLPPGEYKLSFMYSYGTSQTTAPVIAAFSAVPNWTKYIFESSDGLQQSLDSQTSFPSSESALFFSDRNLIPAIWPY